MRDRYLAFTAALLGAIAISALAIFTSGNSASAQSQASNFADNSPQSFANDVMPIFRPKRHFELDSSGREGQLKSQSLSNFR